MRHAARRRPRHRSVSVSIASSSPAGAMALEGASNVNVAVSVTGGGRCGGAGGAYERRGAPDRDDRSGPRRPTRDTSLSAGDSLSTKSASGPIGSVSVGLSSRRPAESLALRSRPHALHVVR